jgi:hypothetical protein
MAVINSAETLPSFLSFFSILIPVVRIVRDRVIPDVDEETTPPLSVTSREKNR